MVYHGVGMLDLFESIQQTKKRGVLGPWRKGDGSVNDSDTNKVHCNHCSSCERQGNPVTLTSRARHSGRASQNFRNNLFWACQHCSSVTAGP